MYTCQECFGLIEVGVFLLNSIPNIIYSLNDLNSKHETWNIGFTIINVNKS